MIRFGADIGTRVLVLSSAVVCYNVPSYLYCQGIKHGDLQNHTLYQDLLILRFNLNSFHFNIHHRQIDAYRCFSNKGGLSLQLNDAMIIRRIAFHVMSNLLCNSHLS